MEFPIFPILAHINPSAGKVEGMQAVERRLSELRGVFADEDAWQDRVSRDDPVIYSVCTVEPAQGDGQLHYCLGTLAPGRTGSEYFMTRGHLHMWRPAAEVYLGLRGEGAILLEDERTGESQLVSLAPNSLVYVPGYMAHRTVNTGQAPLVYLGIYPASAGHDYSATPARNFRMMVVAVGGRPALINRADFSPD